MFRLTATDLRKFICIIERKEDLQGQLATVQKARDWYNRYTPQPAFEGNYLETNWEGLRDKKIAELNAEIQSLRTRIATQGKAEAGDSSTSANNAAPDVKHGNTKLMPSMALPSFYATTP